MSTTTSGCRVEAPAKINLTLEILGRRPDGYHDIRSLLVPLELADTVELREAAADGLEILAEGVSLEAIGAPRDNLALRAVELLRAHSGTEGRGVAISIRKRIPVGGGLGGGSADAAAALVGLDRLWGLGWPRERLMELGARLGSDVPALVHGGAVCMEGRGERVTPALAGEAEPPPGGRMARFTVLLVNPGLAVPTGKIYASCFGRLTSGQNSYKIVSSALRSGDLDGAAAGLFNGLEEIVFEQYPGIGRLAQRLKAAGAPGVLLSGSGATVFALVRDAEHGESIRRCLPGGYWSRVTATLPDGVMAAHGFLEP